MVGMEASGPSSQTEHDPASVSSPHRAAPDSSMGSSGSRWDSAPSFTGCRICTVVSIFSVASHSSLPMNSPASSSSAFNSTVEKDSFQITFIWDENRDSVHCRLFVRKQLWAKWQNSNLCYKSRVFFYRQTLILGVKGSVTRFSNTSCFFRALFTPLPEIWKSPFQSGSREACPEVTGDSLALIGFRSARALASQIQEIIRINIEKSSIV